MDGHERFRRLNQQGPSHLHNLHQTHHFSYAPASMMPPPAGFWEPPQDFSPKKAFPSVVETADVSMGDDTTSPGSVNRETKEDTSTTDEEKAVATVPSRKVSTNAIKRVFI